jgi:antitoxin (DNA-binding transcriptional repressor) of toxin-antitoxin stability system
MTVTVDVTEAKAKFSELVECAGQTEEIIFTMAVKPVVKGRPLRAGEETPEVRASRGADRER